jgi:hypothetical protein
MNIPLCQLIAMPIVRPTLKINVLKMKQVFQMNYRQGIRSFLFPQLISKVKLFIFQLLNILGVLFERNRMIGLRICFIGGSNLRPLSGKMFDISDENHKLQAWFPYLHPFEKDWHICMDSFVIDTKSGLVEL